MFIKDWLKSVFLPGFAFPAPHCSATYQSTTIFIWLRQQAGVLLSSCQKDLCLLTANTSIICSHPCCSVSFPLAWCMWAETCPSGQTGLLYFSISAPGTRTGSWRDHTTNVKHRLKPLKPWLRPEALEGLPGLCASSALVHMGNRGCKGWCGAQAALGHLLCCGSREQAAPCTGKGLCSCHGILMDAGWE